MAEVKMKDWLERYKSKMLTADQAIRKIRRGSRIFLGTGCGVPIHLVQALAKNADVMADNEIVHLLTLGETPSADPEFQNQFRHNAFFISDNLRDAVIEGRADYTPIMLSDIPRLFRSGRMPLDVALIQVSPPDEHGFCSLGISVDITKSAAETADMVIAQVNERMPLTHGDTFINVRDIDYLVPYTEPIVEFHPPEPDETIRQIGLYVARLVENESTLELGIGALPQAVCTSLLETGVRDLGIHTEMFSDSLIELIEAGIVTCKKKNLHPGKVIASFIMGSKKLYDYVDGNPLFEFHPSEYVNDPYVIAQNNKMVAINSALEIDLTGQVCADSIGPKFYSGIGGQVDFIRGAKRSPRGKAIICMPSTAMNGTVSRIVPQLSEGAGVVTTRGDVDIVVTEYGLASLHGKTIRERVLSLIAIAHPKFRNELLEAAKAMKYVFEDQVPFLSKGTYFATEYETSEIFQGPEGPIEVHFRLIRPDDADRIKDLFYDLSEESIFFRFLAPLKSLRRQTLHEFYNVDQDRDISIVAVIHPDEEGEAEKIIGAARYLLDRSRNEAEFALLVQDEYQHRGIGSFMLNHLMRIAKSKGIETFVAYVHPQNYPMIRFLHKTGKIVESRLNMADDEYIFKLKL
ncbi:MAG: 4-hydroxybutyrate CoA-transferase [Candidatus Thorarchaeota archaeon]|nr:MAG: 4-hydroxybutyrate CoA-transferase [Candidatus Thorarchaeota archaeon]RLI60374.1 MAG: 4-hydroxybutyrate CoA-transferase [Candidatus Thorarchaeota archaeon]